MFIQISRETMLLLINNLHKNVRDNCSFTLRVYSEHSTGKVFLALLYHIIQRKQLEIPLNYVILLVLFKVNAFPFKNKDKSHIFHARQLLLCVARRHVCFVLKQSVTVTSLN